MNKKFTAFLLSGVLLTTTAVVFAAKYTINTSGTVKNQAGQTITSPANSVNQNFYNTFTAQDYVNNNVVN